MNGTEDIAIKAVNVAITDNVNTGILNSFIFNTGWFARTDFMINRIINSIDTVNKVIDIAEFNPVLEAIVIPDNKNAKPAINNPAPAQSKSDEIFVELEFLGNNIIDNAPDIKERNENNINKARQSIKPAINPPINGPIKFPRDTNMRFNPIALPFWVSSNALTAMIKDVPCIIPPPTPCTNLANIRKGKLGAHVLTIPPIVNISSPVTITFLLPIISESRPIGTKSETTVRKYIIVTHWAVGRSAENSSDISGSIILSADLSVAVINIENAAVENISQW